MHIPATPTIQIVPLTRGAVVTTATYAFACTNTADILRIVAELLEDESLVRPAPGYDQPMPAPGPTQASPPTPVPTPVPTPAPAPGPDERNPLWQRNNLLALCDRWASGQITDEQFNDLLDQWCPDISLDEAMLTRDSFTQRDDGVSQLPYDESGEVVRHG